MIRTGVAEAAYQAKRIAGQLPKTESPLTRLAADSRSVATWTAVSRVTGFARAITIATVLGPTYLGNTFQATNLIPNLTYEFLTGSVLVSLLVPPLVRHVDRADRATVERVAGGFLGLAVVAFSVVTLVAVLAGPLMLRVFSMGVEDPVAAAAQRHVGVILLAMLMPQVVLYGVAGTCAAIMNAHGRFALAAAAPALENLGVIATMGTTAFLFGRNLSLQNVTSPQLLMLGMGTTTAVALHAAGQWWGVRRLGIRLLPRAGWRDPEIRALARQAGPSLGYAGLNALRNWTALVVANRVPGGVVAFQLALNFYYLPIAVGARPVAVAALPQLARLHRNGEGKGFANELVRSCCLASFFTVPAAIAYIGLSGPLSRAVSFGSMAAAGGAAMVAISLAALGPGVVSEAQFVLATQAAYARNDSRKPFQAMILRTAVTLLGMAIALWAARGSATLLVLGLAVSSGNLVAALWLIHRVRSGLPRGDERFLPGVARILAAALLAIGPAYVLGGWLSSLVGDRLGPPIGMTAATVVGLAGFVGIQWVWRSPELESLLPAGKSRR